MRGTNFREYTANLNLVLSFIVVDIWFPVFQRIFFKPLFIFFKKGSGLWVEQLKNYLLLSVRNNFIVFFNSGFLSFKFVTHFYRFLFCKFNGDWSDEMVHDYNAIKSHVFIIFLIWFGLVLFSSFCISGILFVCKKKTFD